MSDKKKEIVKKYSNGEITILWNPKTCIHAAECVNRLPNVYKPKEKPWITIENATTQELIDQIDKCPSGALLYNLKNLKINNNMEKIKINAMENGPLLVEGNIEVTKPDGSIENKEKTTAFCRCGASVNKPYCDGKHRNIEFKG